MRQHSLRQHGSAHVIIIIVLIVALLSALGFIFWQNFSKTSDSSLDKKPTNKVASSNGETGQKYCAKIEKLCFNYPTDWSLDANIEKKQSDLDYNVDKITLTDKAATVKLTLDSGIDGLGGMCVPEETAGAFFHTVKATKLGITTESYNEAYNVPNLYAIAAIDETADGKFTPTLYLTAAKTITTVGKYNICSAFLTSFFYGRNAVISEQGNYGSVRFSTTDDSTYSSYEAAKAALDTKAYTAAFGVLTSASYE